LISARPISISPAHRDNEVIGKPFTPGGMERGLRVVASGLDPADRVMVDGLANPFIHATRL
jgi:hypothetical protein